MMWKAISSAPGIGEKTAQKLIVELKDKLSIEDALEHLNNRRWCFKAQMSTGGEIQSEAVQGASLHWDMAIQKH